MALTLFILFVLIPIVEIYLFIEIGGYIGTGWTILLIIATAFFGLRAMRLQGLAVLAEAQAAQISGRPPVAAAAHGVLILLAGALLLTPGFFTDSLGFLLLWRPVRVLVLETALGLIMPVMSAGFMRPPPDGGPPFNRPDGARHGDDARSHDSNIIEGDYRVEDDKRR